nr:hypothetical protein [Haladaptatus halobius]
MDEIESEQQARTTLIHTHLPKLADHGIIEYDQRSATVRYRDGRQVEAVLEVAATHGIV